MKNKLLLLISLFFITHFAHAQFQFGIGGGGSAGVGDISAFVRGYNAYIELSHHTTDRFRTVLVGQVIGLAAIPLDNSLSQAWYQVPILIQGRYFLMDPNGDTTFQPYVQGGIGAVRSWYLKTRTNDYEYYVDDQFWTFGARAGVGTTIAMFNIQLNYNYAGTYKDINLGVMDISLGFLF